MRVFGVIGWKNSGKTSLMERLVADITGRGFSVSTVKHVHHQVDLDQRGKMQNCSGPVFGDNRIQPGAVTNIALLDRTPFDEFTMAVRQVVVNDRREAPFSQQQTCVGTDITSPPDNQNRLFRHLSPLLSFVIQTGVRPATV